LLLKLAVKACNSLGSRLLIHVRKQARWLQRVPEVELSNGVPAELS